MPLRSKLQPRSIRYRFGAYGRQAHPLRRLGGRPLTAFYSFRPRPSRSIVNELQSAGLSLDQALQTARTARDNAVPALDPKSTPQSVLRMLRLASFAWRFVFIGVITLGFFNVLTFEFGPLIAVFGLIWLGLVALNGAVAAHFFARYTAIVAGSVWLSRTAGYACQSPKTGPTRRVLRWVAKHSSPWQRAAQLQMAPMLGGFALLCVVCFGAAGWVFVSFDAVGLPTASSE